MKTRTKILMAVGWDESREQLPLIAERILGYAETSVKELREKNRILDTIKVACHMADKYGNNHICASHLLEEIESLEAGKKSPDRSRG